MNRLLLPSLICIVLAGAATAVADAPNVILFIGDDISYNDFGCYGNAAARTPNVDQLAKDGLRFTEAILTASSCSPSRSSIITGRYPHNNGKAAELHEPIAGHLPWFPELLRKGGYYTAIVGKHHMTTSPAADGSKRPKAFDLVDGGRVKGNSGGHGKWVQTVQERPKDQPFFFWFAAYDAHRGWDADSQWDESRYGPKHRPEDVVVPPFLVDNEKTRQDLASYYNEVTRFDYYIGEVVKTLREQGELENTLLLAMADNGRPFPRAKTRLHDSGMKTALVAHWPKGIEGEGLDVDGLVSAIDLAPTILQLAGVKAPETMQGVSMAPMLEDASAKIRQYAFSEHNWHDYEAHGRSVRSDKYLLIENNRPHLAWQGPADSVRSPSHQSLLKRQESDKLDPAQADVFMSPRPQVELYDTEKDPHQLNNLAGNPQYAEVQKRLASVLEQWMEETGDSVPENLSRDSFDRATGERLPLKGRSYRGTTPGEDRGAVNINAPGPR